MADDKNLPEGTDKIVPGAAVTEDELVIVEAVTVEPADPAAAGAGGGIAAAGAAEIDPGPPQNSGALDAGVGSSGSSSTAGGSILEKVRSGSEKLTGQAGDKARDFVTQGLERSGEALANVSRLIGDTADGLDERLGPEYGDYARRAAGAIESTAESLRSKDPDELIEDTRTFIRKSPGVALAGAAIVGFALARLVKTGLESATSRGDRSEGRDSD